MYPSSPPVLSVPPSYANSTILKYIIAPAFEAIEYYETNFPRDFGEPSPYRGTPSIEKDNIWQDLWDCKLSCTIYFAMLTSKKMVPLMFLRRSKQNLTIPLPVRERPGDIPTRNSAVVPRL
jgi:hypothetical protein